MCEQCTNESPNDGLPECPKETPRTGEAQVIAVKFAVGDTVRIRHGVNRDKLGSVAAVIGENIGVQVDGDRGSPLTYFVGELDVVPRTEPPVVQPQESADTLLDRCTRCGGSRMLNGTCTFIGCHDPLWDNRNSLRRERPYLGGISMRWDSPEGEVRYDEETEEWTLDGKVEGRMSALLARSLLIRIALLAVRAAESSGSATEVK